MLLKLKNACQKSVGRSEKSCHDNLQHCTSEELLYTFDTLAVFPFCSDYDVSCFSLVYLTSV